MSISRKFNALPGGPWITGSLGHPDPSFADAYVPWGESMGPRLDDRISGVFFLVFLFYGVTTALIVAGVAAIVV